MPYLCLLHITGVCVLIGAKCWEAHLGPQEVDEHRSVSGNFKELNVDDLGYNL